MLLEGIEGPPAGPCCELGFGQGVSLAMHAATQPERRWWGNDFMPEHAAYARRLVDASGADAVVTDQSFEEFFARDDLPQFAFVGLCALLPAADDETIAAARGPARRLNVDLIGPPARGGKIDALASPVSGGAVAATASLRLMLAARADLPESPAAWPERVWDLMQAEGQQMMKAGAAVSDRATAVAVLRPLVDQFRQGVLPVLQRLQVVD